MKRFDLEINDPSPIGFGGFSPPSRFRQRANPVDARKYDFQAARTHVSAPKSISESVVHMMMLSMGALVLTSHEAYMECGALSAILVNAFLALLVGYCTCVLIWSAQKLYGRIQMAQLSYPDIVEATLLLCPFPKLKKRARVFRYIVEGTLLVNLYGNCIICTIMIARTLKQLVEGQATDVVSDDGDPSLRVYILSLMIPSVIVVMVTDLKNLAPFALMADLHGVIIASLVLIYALSSESLDVKDLPIINSPQGLFRFIGISLFIMEVVATALPVENYMEKPTKFPYVVFFAMLIITFTMVIIGVFGYWQYRDQCMGPVTIHFPNFSAVPITAKVSVCIVVNTVYSLSFYEAFDVEWFYLKKYHQISNYWFWERLYRTIHVIGVICLSYIIPDPHFLMAVIGCLCTTPLIFLYPTFIELILDWQIPGLGFINWRVLRCIFFWIIGLTIVSAGTFYAVYAKLHDVHADLTGAKSVNKFSTIDIDATTI